MFEEVTIDGKTYISLDLFTAEKKMMLTAVEELAKTLPGEDFIILRDITDISSLSTLESFANAYMNKFFALCLEGNEVGLDHGSDEFKIKVAKDILLDFLQKEKEK